MESIHDLANYYDWVSKPKATFMGLSTEIREMIYHECYPENEIKIAWKYDRYNPRPHRDWRWWPAAFPLMLVNRKIRAEILNAIPITVRFQCNGNLSLEFIPKDLRDNMNSLYCNAIDFYDIMREDPFDNLPKLRYVSFKGDINIDRDVMVESGTNGIPILESPIPSESRPDFALLLPRRVTMDESTMADVWAHQICEPNKTLQFTCAVGPFHFTGMNDRPAPHRLATIQVTAEITWTKDGMKIDMLRDLKGDQYDADEELVENLPRTARDCGSISCIGYCACCTIIRRSIEKFGIIKKA